MEAVSSIGRKEELLEVIVDQVRPNFFRYGTITKNMKNSFLMISTSVIGRITQLHPMEIGIGNDTIVNDFLNENYVSLRNFESPNIIPMKIKINSCRVGNEVI